MVLKLAMVLYITLATIGFTGSIISGSTYGICEHHPNADPTTSKGIECVTSGGKLYCDAAKQAKVLNDTLTGLKKVKTLLVQLQKLQQENCVSEGSGVDEDGIKWEDAGVKGVRVKKVEEGGTAKAQNGSLVDGAFVVEL